MRLIFDVNKQIVTRTDNEKVVRLSRNFLYAHFEFSEEWTGEKTAVFRYRNKTYNMLLDSDDTCLVPWEILRCEYFDVSVFCGDLLTANAVRVFTIASGYGLGKSSIAPTPDIYAQIIEKIDGIVAGTIPYDNTESGMGAVNVQEALDELAQGGGGGGGVTPNISMTASVDATTGTPNVEVTKSGTLNNPVFNLAFTGLKGEQGKKGDTGKPPTISASATIDANTGTPSVNVTKTGTDEAPSFAFEFSNLKGAKGDPGANGSVVTVTQTLQSGTKIGSIRVDGTETELFAPSGSGSISAQFEVTTSGWEADTTSQSGSTLYKKAIAVTTVNSTFGVVSIGATGTLPTVAQQAAFDLVQYVTIDDSVPCLYLYASDIPTDSFYIKVEGVA